MLLFMVRDDEDYYTAEIFSDIQHAVDYCNREYDSVGGIDAFYIIQVSVNQEDDTIPGHIEFNGEYNRWVQLDENGGFVQWTPFDDKWQLDLSR